MRWTFETWELLKQLKQHCTLLRSFTRWLVILWLWGLSMLQLQSWFAPWTLRNWLTTWLEVFFWHAIGVSIIRCCNSMTIPCESKKLFAPTRFCVTCASTLKLSCFGESWSMSTAVSLGWGMDEYMEVTLWVWLRAFTKILWSNKR